MADDDYYRFDTLAVHAGASPDATHGSRATPIHLTTAFVFKDSDAAAGQDRVRDRCRFGARPGDRRRHVRAGVLQGEEHHVALRAIGTGGPVLAAERCRAYEPRLSDFDEQGLGVHGDIARDAIDRLHDVLLHGRSRPEEFPRGPV